MGHRERAPEKTRILNGGGGGDDGGSDDSGGGGSVRRW